MSRPTQHMAALRLAMPPAERKTPCFPHVFSVSRGPTIVGSNRDSTGATSTTDEWFSP